MKLALSLLLLCKLVFSQVTNLSQVFLVRPFLDHIPIEEAVKRYVPWKFLSDEDRVRVETLGFNENSWNNPFISDDAPEVEFLDYATIEEDTPQLAVLIDELGFTPRAWDCYVTHYENYLWQDLIGFTDRGEEIQGNLTNLGFFEDNWNTGSLQFNQFWSQLGPLQESASRALCYFDDSWDELPLDEYKMTLDGRVLLPGAQTLRYTPWAELDTFRQLTAEAIGYTETFWNYASGPIPGPEGDRPRPDENHPSAPIEYDSLFDIFSSTDGMQIRTLGFDIFTWDMCVNRFYAYGWSELAIWGIQDKFVDIGWTEERWDSYNTEDFPAIYFQPWNSLSATVQGQLLTLCFDQPRWDRLILQPSTAPPTQAPTATPTQSPTQAQAPTATPTQSPTQAPTPSPTVSDEVFKAKNVNRKPGNSINAYINSVFADYNYDFSFGGNRRLRSKKEEEKKA